MKRILKIISSPNGASSFSIKLADATVEKLLSIYEGSIIITRDLTRGLFQHLEVEQIASFFTPQQLRTDDHKAAISQSDAAISELMAADIIVIGVPMYNFGISSALKAWIDHIVRVGVTFRLTESGGYLGLVENKQVYLAIATGSIYTEGPLKGLDFTEPYLRAILGYTGMTDITAFRVEGTAVPGLRERTLEKAIATMSAQLDSSPVISE